MYNNRQALVSTYRAILQIVARLNPKLITKMYSLVKENNNLIKINVSLLKGFIIINRELINKAYLIFPKEYKHINKICKYYLL